VDWIREYTVYVIPTLTLAINLILRRRSAPDVFSVPKNEWLQYWLAILKNPYLYLYVFLFPSFCSLLMCYVRNTLIIWKSLIAQFVSISLFFLQVQQLIVIHKLLIIRINQPYQFGLLVFYHMLQHS